MSGCCTDDRWQCPHCGGLWSRTTQTHEQWLTNLRRVQVAHGRRCVQARGAA